MSQIHTTLEKHCYSRHWVKKPTCVIGCVKKERDMGGDLQVSCQPHLYLGRGKKESRKSNKDNKVLLSPLLLSLYIWLQLPNKDVTALAELLISEISGRKLKHWIEPEEPSARLAFPPGHHHSSKAKKRDWKRSKGLPPPYIYTSAMNSCQYISVQLVTVTKYIIQQAFSVNYQ